MTGYPDQISTNTVTPSKTVGTTFSDMGGAIGGLNDAFSFRRGNIELSGHSIEYSDDFHELECQWCDTSFEVPDIIQHTTPLRKIVYQLFLLGHFQQHTCPQTSVPSLDRNTDDWTGLPDITPPRNYTINHSNNLYNVDTSNGSVVTDGTYIIDSNDPSYLAGDTLTEEDFMKLRTTI